jgi:hypothetical protein
MWRNTMSANYLDSLMTKYGTDKNIWGYHPYYAEAMEKRRLKVKKVLEIGICGYRDLPNNVVGASLFVWKDYFPNAEIYGIDNDSRFIFHDQQRIQTALADAYDQPQLMRALHSFGFPEFDMIVDDAVHDPEPQLRLANYLMPFLKKDGRYFVEEVCPYKHNEPPEDYFQRGLETAPAHIAMCVTPKPEELGIFIK